MNRDTALNIIRAEFAKHGRATRKSTKAYVENAVGFSAYSAAMRAGLAKYKEAHKND